MYVHKDIVLKIVGAHYHKGELCHPIGKSKNTITSVLGMTEVELIDCPHGTDRCFVEDKHLRKVAVSRKV